MRRLRLPWRLALGAIAAATLLPGGAFPGHAKADSPTLGGYSGSAAASGFHAFYNPEGLLPVAAPVDLGVPDALATITTGPATFARASVADPGDLLVNPDALITLGFAQWKPGTLPPYPYRVNATSGSKTPTAESSPGPGLDARVDAQDTASKATASTPAFTAPPVATVGSMSSLATTTVSSDGSTVTTHALSKVSNFDLLGVLTIDSIVTDLTSTSNGGPVKLTGGTAVTGAAVMGKPVAIDTSGVHNSAGNALNTLLSSAGIHVTLLGPVKVAGSDTGQLGSDGLRIDFDFSQQNFPALKTLVGQLGPLQNPIPGAPGPEDVVKVLQANHVVALELGRGVVSLQATSATVEGDTAAEASVSGGTGSSASPAATLELNPSSIDTPADAAPTAASPTLAASPAVAGVSAPSGASIGAGIGALALLVLLAQPLLGDRLARMANTILAADDGEACPMGDS